MTLTNLQSKARIAIHSDKIKGAIKLKLQKECIKCNVTYNESDTNSQLCEKLNS